MLVVLYIILFLAEVFGKLVPLIDKNCSEDGYYHLGTQIIDHYFADRHYVNVIETRFDDQMLAEEFVCEIQSRTIYVITIERFKDQVASKRSSPYQQSQSINEFPTLEAFFSWGSTKMLVEELFPAIGYWNPQAKIILETNELHHYEIAKVLHAAWYNHKILNILLMNYWNHNQIENCMFNPFATGPDEAGSVKSADLFCTNLTEKDQIHAYFKQVDQYTHDRVTKLNGHTLTIAMHESKGSQSAFDCLLDNFSITDEDMHILNIMQKTMNFTAEYIISDLELSVGYVHSNGSLAGTLNLIENDQVDLAANSRIIHYYETKNLLYLNYISTERLQFLVPIDYYKNRDKKVIFINPFSMSYLSINMVLSVMIPLVLQSLERLMRHTSLPKDHCPFGKSVMQMIGIIYNVSVKQPLSSHKRLVIFGILVYNIVSYPVWQAVTIRYLNSDNQYLNNINSLQELLDSDLILKVSKYHYHVAIYHGSPTQHEFYREVSNRLSAENTSSIRDTIENIIINRDSAFLTSHVYIPLVLAGSYKWVPGNHMSEVYIIPEPVYEFFKSMAVPKTSPFITTFNDIISRCVETGVVEQQERQLKMVVDLMNIRRTLELSVKYVKRVFDMEVLCFFFMFYVMMMALAIVVFTIEVLYHRYGQRKEVVEKQVGKENEETEDENFEPFEFTP